MTTHEIVALRCPSCGGASTQPSREMPFGAEFRCDHCGITSVLIVDRALVPLSTLQKQGEKVCTACGRVAQREARFCQEGHALVRPCIKCLTEFAVDHQRCDFCGWPQSVKPGTDEGVSLAFDNAVSDLANPSPLVRFHALNVIIAGGGTASRAAITAAASALHSLMMEPSNRNDQCWQAFISLGPDAVPTILSIMMDPSFWRTIVASEELIATLRKLGPAVRQAAPILRRQLEEIWPLRWSDGWYSPFSCLSAISPEDALAFCGRSLEEGGKNRSKENEQALWQAVAVGKPAIPVLEKFCGPFSGPRGRACARAISALREGNHTPSLLWG